ncbi:MAG: hypothetical protein A2504_16375 [Bdellovibrionales bacterium RIFOXYD12_FULL_39_22]|nr:MAG: hypothetical protein A2385_10030 [Bdellovibrionales bacterium RIFOXYB1_FULL_39_21]OFZ45439.1 MAG: hypothetical protein A2404_01275 [Bdellovibrionales bacterium RIFOXYC1_FULL_39_130]OFZ70409.1 MAG: hypothetical protein A2451_08260 [Bdellovibrionales bacterium RIFOXYC2_FULL_39_8]OFZ74642.1 MAG: hypothetical protein A2560_09600 [Bdellovibrionales bacterium RIFOXYD1_FULL_39_84]OFZ92951.1 MAG: hypothetical protein A2504_16375 [Bdellovibrionales bacterium RIFOXYD12_FULL_39_22]HLE12802.1 hypo
MSSSCRIKNNHGVSLVDLLTGTAIFALILAAAGSLIKDVTNKGSKILADRDINSVITNMQEILATPASCKESFFGKNPQDSTSAAAETIGQLFEAKDSVNKVPRYIVGTRYGKIRIENYRLSDAADNVDAELGSTDLLVTFLRDGDKKIENRVFKKIKIAVWTDESGLIEKCQAITASTIVCDCINSDGEKMECYENEEITGPTSPWSNLTTKWIYICLPNHGRVNTGFRYTEN